MLISVSSQAYIFLFTVLGGIIIGFIYDLFRVSRKVIKTNNFIVYFEDIIFWLVSSIALFGILFFSNAGEIRGYAIIGVVLGIIIYAMLFSHYAMKILLKAVDIFLKIIKLLYKIISFPIKYIIKIFYIPISFICNIIKKLASAKDRILGKISFRIKLNIKNLKILRKKF